MIDALRGVARRARRATAGSARPDGLGGTPAGPSGAGDWWSPSVPQLAGLFALFAAYASLLALLTRGAESVWGTCAAGAYLLAALVVLVLSASRRTMARLSLLVALAGAFVLPAAILPDTWQETDEVIVVARAAKLWLAHGTPYLPPTQLVSSQSYNPYLPGMSLFGLPGALGLRGWLADPLVWLALATLGLLTAAGRVAASGGEDRRGAGRRRVLPGVLLLLACPVFALPLSLGVTDPPVIALLCLGLAWTVPSARAGAAAPAGTPGALAARRSSGSIRALSSAPPLWAGLAIGTACALKATAWPAFPVIAALFAARDGRRAAARFAGGALCSALLLVGATAPALLASPSALWQNLVAYPLGLSRRPTPAASPLPGHVLAGAGGLGHLVAIGLLGLAAVAMIASLLLRPPRTVAQAAVRLAVGLTVMFLLAPDARFGYFAYPLGILGWLAVGVAIPRRAGDRPAPRGSPDAVRRAADRGPAQPAGASTR